MKIYYGLGTVLMPGKQIKEKHAVSVLQEPTDIWDDDLPDLYLTTTNLQLTADLPI